jgi:hypothetical protein
MGMILLDGDSKWIDLLEPNLKAVFTDAYMTQWSADTLGALYKYPAKPRTKLQRAIDNAVKELST